MVFYFTLCIIYYSLLKKVNQIISIKDFWYYDFRFVGVRMWFRSCYWIKYWYIIFIEIIYVFLFENRWFRFELVFICYAILVSHFGYLLQTVVNELQNQLWTSMYWIFNFIDVVKSWINKMIALPSNISILLLILQSH